MTISNKPVIGITFDHEKGSTASYSKFPWYALRENYCSAIANAGGIPFPLAFEFELMDKYMGLIDGLMVTGGNFDVDPLLFNTEIRHETVKTKSKRTEFEMQMTQRCLDKDYPILGICGGQQLLNVVLGGTLIQHIPDEVSQCLAHEQPNPRDEAGHTVEIKNKTLLHQIVNRNQLEVNSAHHQAVKDAGSGVVINAVASDGVIEGIELPSQKFCLGLQWHPEFIISQGDSDIFKAFIKASSEF